jgi:phytoene dehydrogenase-like protein
VRLARTKLLSSVSKARVGLLLGRLQQLDPEPFDGVSVAAWFEQLGMATDARELIRTVIRTATYVDDVETFSAGAAIRQLQLALGESVVYLDGGWQQLVDRLIERSTSLGVSVHTGEAVCSIRPDTSGRVGRRWIVESGARRIAAASVVVAPGSPDAVDRLLPGGLDRSGLGAPATAACLELAVRGVPESRLLLGVGDPLYLSVHSPPARLAPDGISVVHVMRYGARTSGADRQALWAHAAAAGIDKDQVVAQRFLHRMVVTGGIPIASAGGLAGRPPVEVPGRSGLYLAGDWVGGEGLIADASFASGQRAGRLAAAGAVHRAAAAVSLAG